MIRVTNFPHGSAKIYRKQPVNILAVEMVEDFEVQTLEGVMTGKKGDYLIQGIQLELYPCKRDIFKASYEEKE